MRLDVERSAGCYRALAEQPGFQVVNIEVLGFNQKAFFIRLHKLHFSGI
jgi:hypothetical protein